MVAGEGGEVPVIIGRDHLERESDEMGGREGREIPLQLTIV